MFFNIILLLALDLRAYGFNYAYNDQTTAFENQVQLIDYNTMGHGSCPNIRQPLCATNGRDFLFFENQCQLEVKNYEQLIQGLQEYFECPLSYCSPQCRPCSEIYQPVCALDIQTQHMETFPNACEVERKTCTTQKVYSIISAGPCHQTSADKCPQSCSKEYQPICAEFQHELKEFSNQCELQKEICLTNKAWQITDFSYCALIRGNDIIEPVSLPPTTNECPDFCTLENKPICARFMTLEKEFSNECELKATICETKQEWLIVRHGPCHQPKENNNFLSTIVNTKCPQFCTLEYKPVCARFNQELKEFANNCELESTKCKTQQDWQIVNQGPCLINTNNAITPSCPKFCTREYEPICAEFNTEMKEFPNQCVLLQTICETNTKWEVINLGPCETNCAKFCTKEFKPICAEFQGQLRQFPNECELQRSICETKIDWQLVPLILCTLDSEHNVESIASEVVCATNGKINKAFNNILELQQEIKSTGIVWSLLHNDDCSQPSSYDINRPTSTPDASYKTTSATIVPQTIYETAKSTTIATPSTIKTTNIPQTIYKTVKFSTTTTPSTAKTKVTTAPYTATQTTTPSPTKTTSTTTETTTPSTTTKTTKYTTKSAPSTTTITASTAPSTTNSKGTTTQQTTKATTPKTTTGTAYKTTKYIPQTSTTQTTTIITTPRTTTTTPTNEEYSARHCEEHFNCCNDYESVEEKGPYSEENFDYDHYDSLEVEEETDTSDIIASKPEEKGQRDKAHVEIKNAEKGSVIRNHKTEKYDAGYKESLNEKPNGGQRSNALVEKNSLKAAYTNTQQASLQKTLETPTGKRYNSLSQNRSETTYLTNQNTAKPACLNEQQGTLDRPNNVVTYNLRENSFKVNGLTNENLPTQPISSPNVTALSGSLGLSNIENDSPRAFSRNEIQNSFNAKPVYTQEAIPNPITSIANEPKAPEDSSLLSSLPEKNSEIYENLASEDSSEEFTYILQDQQSYNSEESLETDLSYELNQQYLPHGLVKEKAPKFGVYSNEAYGLDNLYDVNIKMQQDDHNIGYTITAPGKEPEASDNLVKIYEAYLDKSDSEEVDDEYLVNKVLSTLATETTSAYPIFGDETQNKLNHTKREEYPVKSNATSTSNKKGEIYNGVVYKAPVYDAPTYNFIYTSPYQASYPWLMPHNQFLNYPGMPTKPQDVQTLEHKSPANVQDPDVPFNPLEFLRALGGIPNLLSLSSAAENQIESRGNEASVPPPLYSFQSIPLSQVMPQTQPMPAGILSSSVIPNSIPPSSLSQYESNTEISKPQMYENIKNSNFQPSYPFYGPLNPQPPLNVFPYQALQPLTTASEYKDSAVPSPSVPVPLTYLPNSLPSQSLNSPNSAFNITVFNKLLEALRNLK